jgi:hypothetical protein
MGFTENKEHKENEKKMKTRNSTVRAKSETSALYMRALGEQKCPEIKLLVADMLIETAATQRVPNLPYNRMK